VASAPQQIAAAGAVLILVMLAFVAGRRPWPRSARRAPRAWMIGVTAFVLAGAFWMAMWGWPPSWWDLGIRVLLLAGAVAMLCAWSRRTGWGAPHRLALAAGPLLTYAWFGFLMTEPSLGSEGTG